MAHSWAFETEIWEAEAMAAWAFVTVPPDVDEEIRLFSGPPRGFGSVRVEVALGDSTWQTSVFPDKARGFVLPLKKAVRRAESLEIGDRAALRLTLLDG